MVRYFRVIVFYVRDAIIANSKKVVFFDYVCVQSALLLHVAVIKVCTNLVAAVLSTAYFGVLQDIAQHYG